MANLTISIEDDVLKRARIRALEQNTSVNALVRDYLVSYAGSERYRRGLRAFLDSARRSSGSSGGGGRRWTRDELYDDV